LQLSNFAHGKDNNFNLIRILAALAVLVTHSFALTGQAEPLREQFGMTLGSIAVDIFFIASGFLVTASLLNRQSAIDFFWARVLRIYPALLITLLLTILVLGPLFTTLPLSAYFHDSKVYTYLIKGVVLLGGLSYTLPGVFADNPYKDAVNGSLWTMPYEVRMYAMLAVAWLILRPLKASRARNFQLATLLAFATSGIVVLVEHGTDGKAGQFERLFFMFFTGAAFYTLRSRIVMSGKIFWPCLAALCAAAVAGKQVFFVAYIASLAYLLFYLAYRPGGAIRRYNLVGDYSYGTYIYAFPIQQMVAALMPGVSEIFKLVVA
jgi:peptidoglycan/LPS O-acetylase OafA/YrhL